MGCLTTTVTFEPSDAFREAIQPPEIAWLFDYWLDRRDGRGVLPRAHFDPTDMPRLLPHLFLMDIERSEGKGAALTFRYRLIGTQVQQAMGEGVQGRLFEDIRHEPMLGYLNRFFGACALNRCAGYGQSHGQGSARYKASYCRLIFPVCSKVDGEVDQILGAWLEVEDERCAVRGRPVWPMASEVLDTMIFCR
jgi:hypothetical protein